MLKAAFSLGKTPLLCVCFVVFVPVKTVECEQKMTGLEEHRSVRKKGNGNLTVSGRELDTFLFAYRYCSFQEETEMQNILRNLVLAPVVLAASALTANVAMAESTVDVPFNFQIAGKTLPAGQYILDKNINSSVVTMKNKETAQAFNWILTPGNPAPNDIKVVMRFDGETHALRTVQYGSMITPRLDKKTWRSEHAPTQVVLGR